MQIIKRGLFMLTMARTIRYFWRDLRDLVEAGMPLVESLKVIFKGLNPENPFAKDLAVIMSEVAAGSSFYGALAKHNRFFGQLEINLIKASEMSGILDIALLRLTDDSTPTKADEYDKFYAALGACVAQGVPILASMKAAQVYGTGALGEALKKCHDDIKEGCVLATPMEDSGLFSEGEIELVDLGYEVGNLEVILQRLS